MQSIHSLAEFQSYRKKIPVSAHPVGLVPTMGALHEGHLSLIRKASECNTVIVTIFVNPTQFNDPRDLENYPRNIERDLALLEKEKVDLVFIPSAEEMYPVPDTRKFDFGNLDKVMEGLHRPGHFNGVAQVVSKLFDIIKPERAYFGQKDFQQLTIIRELVRMLNFKIEIVSCPVIREKNGLAMSSRNELLSPAERENAAGLFRVLKEATNWKNVLSVKEVKERAASELSAIPDANPEYFEIVDSKTLDPIINWEHEGTIVACLAVKINQVRLIDNLIFD